MMNQLCSLLPAFICLTLAWGGPNATNSADCQSLKSCSEFKKCCLATCHGPIQATDCKTNRIHAGSICKCVSSTHPRRIRGLQTVTSRATTRNPIVTQTITADPPVRFSDTESLLIGARLVLCHVSLKWQKMQESIEKVVSKGNDMATLLGSLYRIEEDIAKQSDWLRFTGDTMQTIVAAGGNPDEKLGVRNMIYAGTMSLQNLYCQLQTLEMMSLTRDKERHDAARDITINQQSNRTYGKQVNPEKFPGRASKRRLAQNPEACVWPPKMPALGHYPSSSAAAQGKGKQQLLLNDLKRCLSRYKEAAGETHAKNGSTTASPWEVRPKWRGEKETVGTAGGAKNPRNMTHQRPNRNNESRSDASFRNDTQSVKQSATTGNAAISQSDRVLLRGKSNASELALRDAQLMVGHVKWKCDNVQVVIEKVVSNETAKLKLLAALSRIRDDILTQSSWLDMAGEQIQGIASKGESPDALPGIQSIISTAKSCLHSFYCRAASLQRIAKKISALTPGMEKADVFGSDLTPIQRRMNFTTLSRPKTLDFASSKRRLGSIFPPACMFPPIVFPIRPRASLSAATDQDKMPLLGRSPEKWPSSSNETESRNRTESRSTASTPVQPFLKWRNKTIGSSATAHLGANGSRSGSDFHAGQKKS